MRFKIFKHERDIDRLIKEYEDFDHGLRFTLSDTSVDQKGLVKLAGMGLIDMRPANISGSIIEVNIHKEIFAYDIKRMFRILSFSAGFVSGIASTVCAAILLRLMQ